MNRYPISTRNRIRALTASLPALLIPAGARAQSPVATPAGPIKLETELIAQITGPAPGINDTYARFMVYGTDLGSSFLFHDEVGLVFGDTFGYDKKAWRSNCLAFSTDTDPSDGITIDRMITNDLDAAREILPSKKIDFDEMTVIPTYGITVNDRIYLHYMSVYHWGPPGRWDLGHAGFAWSDDGGESWTMPTSAQLPGDTPFGQVAMEHVDGDIYIWGIPGGRYGGVHLARVAPDHLAEFDHWTYWDGSAWSPNLADAVEVIPPNVGELSVRFNSYYNRWIMMYLNDPGGLMELRIAESVTGPWSDPMIAADKYDYPDGFYAPFMYPKWNDGPDIYFNMSRFGPYQVYLLKTRLPEHLP